MGYIGIRVYIGVMAVGFMGGFPKRFPKIGLPSWGVPITRIVKFWGPYWGSLNWGNYHTGVGV